MEKTNTELNWVDQLLGLIIWITAVTLNIVAITLGVIIVILLSTLRAIRRTLKDIVSLIEEVRDYELKHKIRDFLYK